MTGLREAAEAAGEQLRRQRREAEADWVTAQFVPEQTPWTAAG